MKRDDRKSQYMEDIINAGFALLQERSWDSITSDGLAAKAKMTKRTLYSYVRSQDRLYLYLVKTSFMRFNDYIEISLSSDMSMKATLLAVGRCYFEFYRSHPVEGRLIASFRQSHFEQSEPDLIRDIETLANRFEPSRLIDLRNEDVNPMPRSLGLFLWSSIHGLIQLIESKSEWLFDYYDMTYDQMIDSHLHTLASLFPKEAREKE